MAGLVAVLGSACSESEPVGSGEAGRGGASHAGGNAAGQAGDGEGGVGAGSAGTSGRPAGESGESGSAGENASGGSAGANEASRGGDDESGGFFGGGAGGAEAGSGGDGGEMAEVEPRPIPVIDESALPEPLTRAGFIEIAPVTYVTRFGGSTEPRTSVRARLFYNLLPADEGAKDRPLLVVFNGGPGAATSLLRSFGTGRRTLDAEDLAAPSVDNALRLTSLGNVLYIDCRQAGYSDSLLADPSSEDARKNASNSQSVNEAFDAADFLRVVLRVLHLEPALKNNPVVLVGESYGGLRAPLMLYLLLNATKLGDTNFGYYDPELRAEAVAHASHVFQLPQSDLTPRQMAQQFGWQVLLQPVVGANHQFRRISAMRADALARAALALGISIEEAETRCRNDVSREQAWCDAVLDAADRVSVDATEFSAFTGLSPTSVAGLPAAQRTGAFRLIALEPASESEPLGLGALPAWDRYYLPLIGATSQDRAYWFDSYDYTAATFLHSASYAKTVITNARYDMNIIGESAVPALRDFMVAHPSLGLTQVRYEGPDPDVPSETIRLEFAANALLGRGGTRFVHFPSFPKSGHFVSVSEPERLHATIAEFLAEEGLGNE